MFDLGLKLKTAKDEEDIFGIFGVVGSPETGDENLTQAGIDQWSNAERKQ